MSNIEFLLCILIAVIILIFIAYVVLMSKKHPTQLAPKANNQLILQAYERMLLMIDRISFPQLLRANYAPNKLGLEICQAMIYQLTNEFDYNRTQQVYLSPSAWEKIENYKNHQLEILEKIGNFLLDETLTAVDFSAYIMQFEKENKNEEALKQLRAYVSVDAKNYL